jgi:DNA-binding transcriptional ArsR family regulator
MNLDDYTTITKALGDGTRVRMLLALEPGELCVCQLAELFDVAPSTVSKHMSVLRQAGFVASRKDGRWVYYRLAETTKDGTPEVRDWTLRLLANSPEVAADRNRLRAVLAMSLEEICRKRRLCC